ncbi:hypothetical protein FACS1894151_02760 [Spirochaetia bacterium]|nr:hypothetical protein FACS1894151_02760 [Spirochaetia bacterium]
MADFELTRNHRLFEMFFRFSREAMFITSRDGIFLEINYSFEQTLGYERGELFGLNFDNIFDSPDNKAEFQKDIENSNVVHHYPVVLRRKDGTLFPCFIDAIIWRESGKIMGYHGIIRSRSDVAGSELLAHYVSDVVEEYIKKTGKNPMEPAKHTVTILSFSLRNAASLAEELSPEAFTEILNGLLSGIMALVNSGKGSVNKISGKGFMAIFGAPVSNEKDTANAVYTAEEVFRYVQNFSHSHAGVLPAPLKAGIGLAAGDVFAGIAGFGRRQEYIVLGEPVSLAGRLATLSASFPEKILMDSVTYAAVKSGFPCRKVFSGIIKGKAGDNPFYGLRSSRTEDDIEVRIDL